MIRVGAVNIDTSHPLGFGEVMEKDTRAKYVGVYNDSFRDDREVEGFIARFGLEKRCKSLDELADMCDIGFIHGCDWDDHLRCALPFLKKGKPVFIDKPLVGNLRDCEKVEALAKEGAVILGASSARYAYEIQALAPEKEEILTVLGTSGVDEFNYGVHIAEAIGGLMGVGAQSVRYVGSSPADTFSVSFEDGRSAVYVTCTGAWQPFGLIVMTKKTTHVIKLDSSRLYAALVEQICNYMEGKPHLLVGTDALLESVKIMLAGLASRENGGEIVKLCALSQGGPSFDGKLFWQKYGAAAGRLFSK